MLTSWLARPIAPGSDGKRWLIGEGLPKTSDGLIAEINKALNTSREVIDVEAAELAPVPPHRVDVPREGAPVPNAGQPYIHREIPRGRKRVRGPKNFI